MLFQSQVPSLFQTLGMQLDQSVNQARKAETVKRLAYYHDEQKNYIVEQLTAVFSEPDKLTPAFLNICKKIVNQTSAVYHQDAKREIDGTVRDKEIFTEINSTAALPVKMKMASRYTKLLKTVLLRPVWRRSSMDLDILTGEILDVQTGETPEILEAVLITHYPESLKQEEVEFSYWTPETVRRLNYLGEEIRVEKNPYQMLPFVPCFDRCPTNDFWLSGGDDLIIIQDAINEKLTDLMYTCRQQGFGVGWLKNGKGGGSLTLDPGSMVELPEDGSLGFESQRAPIREILEAIQFLITQAAVSNGLSASSLSTKVQRESGTAKVQANRELEEIRRDDIPLWRKYEQDLFNAFKAVWNIHNPRRKFSDNVSMKVDFIDPRPVISAKDQAESWEKLISLGVMSPVDVIMERNPDLRSREEATTYLERIQEENAKFNNGNTSPTQA